MPRKGTPRPITFFDGLMHFHHFEGAHHLAEVADAGEDDLGCGAQLFGSVDEPVGSADFGEGVLHAAQVPRPVVDDADHNSPLVDGS